MAWQDEFRKYQVTIPSDYMVGSDQLHPKAGQTIDVAEGSADWNKFINTGLVKEVNTVPQTSYNTFKDIATSGAGYSNLQVMPDSSGNYAARYTDSSGQQHQSDLQGFLTSRNINLATTPGQGPTSATGTSAVANANLAAERVVSGMNQPKPTQPTTPNFIGGLSNTQKQSITNLMASRPSSQWSATDVKNWNYATGGQALPSGYPETPPSDKMTVDSFNKVSGINLPKISIPGLSTADGMVQGANTELQNIVNSLTVSQTPAEQKQQSLLDQMASLVGSQSNKAADQLTAEQSAGIPQLKQQFADINAKILSKMAEYKALSTDQEGKPVTMNSIVGSQAQIQRVAASDIGLLQAQAQGLQGQLTTAQETVNRAIDLKYSTIESKLNIYQAQLNALQPTLNKEEKIQAQAQQILVNQQQQALNEQKQAEKDKTNFVLDLVSKYPDAGINLSDSPEVAQSKIKNSRIYQQATRLVGGGNNNTPSKVAPINNTVTPNDGTEESIKISKLSPRAQAVYNNPSLMSNYTATEKGKITDEIINAGLDLQTAGKTTETEKLTAGYVGRMNAANNIITNFESSNPKAGASGFFQSLLPDWTASNLLKTGDFQSMQQAERDFINAVLRKESGAAIAPSEFSNAEKQYFPQPGDSAQVIAQKKANRLKTIEGMTNAAGTAIKSNTKSNSNEDPLGLR